MLYPAETVDRAVRYYCEARDEAPTLDSFLIALDEIHRGRATEFFNMQSQAFTGCRKCNDFGYFLTVYPSGIEARENCHCKEHKDYFQILDSEVPLTDKDCFAKFGVSLRFFDRSLVRVVRRPRIQLYMNGRNSDATLAHAKKMGYAKADADSMADRYVIYDVRYGEG